MNRGLYIHIPFCHKICSYCDFVKRVSKKEKISQYIDLLVKEIEIYKNIGFDFSKVNSIYIGGGTPSILNIDELRKIFNKVFEYINIDNIQEFTVEFNPEDLNKEIIDFLTAYNVNRVSIGIQTFSKRLLNLLNRDFDIDKFIENYNYLKEKISNINIDLMYAIPTQTIEELEESINKTLKLDPKHLSIYSLILEENTIFYNKLKNNEIELCPEAIELQMVDKINKLIFPTFKKYEVSNFSLENYQSRHNLIYWNNEEYLGLGVSAYIDKFRFNNTKSLKEYISCIENNNVAVDYVEELTILDEKKYHLIMGFRLVEGIDVIKYNDRFNGDIFEDFPKLNEFINNGYMEYNKSNIFIIEKYFYVMNHLLEQLI